MLLAGGCLAKHPIRSDRQLRQQARVRLSVHLDITRWTDAINHPDPGTAARLSWMEAEVMRSTCLPQPPARIAALLSC